MPGVLFVDNDDSSRELFRAVLEAEGVSVTVCATAEHAIERLEAARPSVIVTDLMLPREDGLQLSARLKQDPQTRQIPVILLTGVDRGRVMARAEADCVDCVLIKPVDPGVLVETIKDVFRASALGQLGGARRVLRAQLPGDRLSEAERPAARRLQEEFAQSPTLALTPAQAARLAAVDGPTCEKVLQSMLRAGVLRRLPDGRYVRQDSQIA